jgi:hypothetical protein
MLELCADPQCTPMEQYVGTVVLQHACQAPTCTTVSVQPAPLDIDDCVTSCLHAGYQMCKAVQFKPAGAFGLDVSECLMFSIRIQDMGVHATAQVLASEGLGAVAASYCRPPEAEETFPNAKVPFYGVDWEDTCEKEGVEVVQGQPAMAFVPDMQLGCASCVFIPPHRKDRLQAASMDTLHYR